MNSSHACAFFLSLLLIFACTPASDAKPGPTSVPPGAAVAIFAGGCFWCMEGPFESVKGVYFVESGYTGGKEIRPTYEQVSSSLTSHCEAVRVLYDSKVIRYDQLLDIYWQQIDPTDAGGQFADRGHQYRPAIFYANEDEKQAVERSRSELQKSGRFSKPIAVAVEKAGPFYPAEEYHQDYYRKNPEHYKRYRELSGRGPFLRKHWP